MRKSIFEKVSVDDQWWKPLLSSVIKVKKKGDVLDDSKTSKGKEEKEGHS